MLDREEGVRIDVVSIFPDYLRPLELSLPGKARESGLVDLRVHDLRSWTHDRHRTVDDTPYGGGAGMVLKPEPWGDALDDLVPTGEDALLVVLTPSGERFTQQVARRLVEEPRLVLACGRYEGIDHRVIEHAQSRMRVLELSIGDYVLNGGEAAALVVVEAVIRLLPGFMGNAESIVEESHEAGLLEHPVYTKPSTWRGLEVPEVLRSGDHGRVAAWRLDQARRRTAHRRPDLLHPSAAIAPSDLADGAGVEWRPAVPGDAAELLTLQRAAFAQEAVANEGVLRPSEIPPLTEDLDDVTFSLTQWTTYVLRAGGRLIGSVRARVDGADWLVGRIMVAPDLQGHGWGRWLLAAMEAMAPETAGALVLITGPASSDNLRMYRKAGYRPDRTRTDGGLVRLTKRRRPGTAGG